MLRVLIADDSPLVRDRLLELIAMVGDVTVVGQTEDACETIQAIRRLRPDVAILDVRLGKGDGLQVLKTVKADASPPVVIMLTAFPYPQYRHRCLEAGAEYFLDKATEFDQIAEVLEGLANRTID